MVVCGDPEQDIFQVGERRDARELAALHERIKQGGAARPLEAASEEPILPVIEVLR